MLPLVAALLPLLLLLPLGWRVFAGTKRRAELRARWPHLLLLGLTGVGAYNALQYMALRTSTPLNVTLIAASSPVWAMAIGAVFYGERPHRAQVLGAVLSLAGVAVVLARGQASALLRVQLVPGDLLMMAAVVSGVGEWLQPSPGPVHWTPWLVAALAYVSIFPSLVAYRLWGLAVTEAGPALATFFGNLTPLFAALLSAALLGEWPQPFHGLAFALIAAGIVVSSRPAGGPRESAP